MSKWRAVQQSFERAHDDLFEITEYTATFYNYTSGPYDPDEGKITGETRTQVAQFNVEYVPPGIDSTIDVDGTSFNWDASIRFPQDDVSEGVLIPLGDDNERCTEVELSDPQESDSTVYELHGYSVEQGSSMLMCRLAEQ